MATSNEIMPPTGNDRESSARKNASHTDSSNSVDAKVDSHVANDRLETVDVATEPISEKPTVPPPQANFSTWSHRQKVALVVMVSCFSFFSPLSANIYYPIFNTLSQHYHVSNTLINLTVTTYMVSNPLTIHVISATNGRARFSKESLRPSLLVFRMAQVEDQHSYYASLSTWVPISG